MKMRKVLVLIITTLFFFSCVPKKELIYFQGEVSAKDSIYKLQNEPYRLQVNDMLYIDINSPDEQLVSVFKNTNSQIGHQGMQVGGGGLYFTSYSID
ncbi:MAG: sugar transporter, partial [Lutimonas sp.]